MAPKSAVSTPTAVTMARAVGDSWKTGIIRAIRYTPAVTIVAACTSADTGVGPAIASGSQTNSGPWADLPKAPSISRIGIQVFTGSAEPAAPSATSIPRAASRMEGCPSAPNSESVPYCW